MAKTNYDVLATTKLPLRAKRFFRNVTQAELSNQSGVHQSRISTAENGNVELTANEKQKIQSVIGGSIDWTITRPNKSNKDDFAMPKEYPDPETAYNKWLKKTHGMKIVRDGEMAVPRIVPADKGDE